MLRGPAERHPGTEGRTVEGREDVSRSSEKTVRRQAIQNAAGDVPPLIRSHLVHGLVVLALVLLSLSAAPRAAAQEGAGGSASSQRLATPLVPQDHWSLQAARRLEGAGLTDPGYDPGTATVTVGRLHAVFREAVNRAQDRPDLRSLAEGYQDRFEEEFPGVAGESGSAAADTGASFRWLGGSLGAGYTRETGRLLAGEGYHNDAGWTGARPLPDVSRGTGELRVLAGFDSWAAVSVSPVVDDGLGLKEGHLAAVVGPVTLWGGRRAFRLGATDRGGLVAAGPDFGDPVDLDGGGAATESFRLPWIFRYLGPFRVESTVTLIDENGEFDNPWMLVLRGRFAPHPRFSFGVNRGAMYGGEGNVSIPFHEVLLRAVLGVRPGQAHGFDNQIVSADVRFRPPLGELPLVVYGEWGAEDSSGSYKDVPAFLGGLEVTALPGLPQLALGIDATRFSESCCGNPSWYRHGAFLEGWSEKGRPLGLPLGGHGREIRIFGNLDVADARGRIDFGVFDRSREAENVFWPQRAGDSRGFALDGHLRIHGRVEMSVSGMVESGEGEGSWDRGALRATARWLF